MGMGEEDQEATGEGDNYSVKQLIAGLRCDIFQPHDGYCTPSPAPSATPCCIVTRLCIAQCGKKKATGI